MTKPQIIGMGGGGFSMEPDNPLLDQYVLAQSGKPRPKVCFVPTASGDSQDYIDRFYAAFKKLNCEPTHLSLYKAPLGSLEEFVLNQDIIYVGGGNTRNLLALWRDWGLDRVLYKAWQQGVVMSGISAGILCWFEEGITDSIPGSLTPIRCLGFLKGSACPHYDGEAERKPSYERLLLTGAIGPGYAVDDGAALHFEGETLVSVVASRPHAKAYRMTLQGTGADRKVSEEVLKTRYLG